MRRWSIVLSLIVVLLSARALSGQGAPQPYTWRSGDLSLLIPSGWSVSAEAPGLQLESGSMRLILTTGPRDFAAVEPLAPLQSALTEHGFALVSYTSETVFGLPGLRAAIASGQRGLNGAALAGWTPDGRFIVLLGGAEPADRARWDQAFAAVLTSLTFSASTPPAPPPYRLIWQTETDRLTDSADTTVIGLAAANDSVYAAVQGRGIVALNAQDGTLSGENPFPDPAQPMDIAAVDQIIYVADSVCRCLLRLRSDGTWLDPVGTFGPNAPLRLEARPDGSLAALDRSSEGYALQLIDASRSTAINLSFNAAAPPLIDVLADGSPVVIEWLTSLMDSSISGALFTLADGAPQLVRWLPFTPEQVRDIAVLHEGQILFALADGTLVIERPDGSIEGLVRLPVPARRLSVDRDGTIYALTESGQIAAYSNREEPDRIGSPLLVPGVPVIGSVSQTIPVQQWQYHGITGERVTINAIAPGTNLGLDAALRLFAPDGRELAYNDDHLGPDLNGIYDAQIRDFILPQTGTYTVQVEWVQFSGSYVLLIARDHTFAPQVDTPVTLNGRIFDAQPVERWVFNGSAGTALTVTMIAETGDLDPTLKLLDPYGVPLAYNDDGRDPELGTNAQLFRVTLPVSGQYVIEASRYAGSGSYALYVVVNSID
ncbi:MAG: PPC domain-containing protein [Candidatus Flexifilum sp.]|jgi:hypothetical protein